MGGWVVGGWVVSGGWWVVCRGSCLFENKKKIYISSLSALSKFAIAHSRINFPELLL